MKFVDRWCAHAHLKEMKKWEMLHEFKTSAWWNLQEKNMCNLESGGTREEVLTHLRAYHQKHQLNSIIFKFIITFFLFISVFFLFCLLITIYNFLPLSKRGRLGRSERSCEIIFTFFEFPFSSGHKLPFSSNDFSFIIHFVSESKLIFYAK